RAIAGRWREIAGHIPSGWGDVSRGLSIRWGPVEPLSCVAIQTGDSMRKKDDTLELFPETYQAGAEFSACGTYRYRLWRIWDTDKPLLLWIMLNPSTADDKQLDPTCARCQKWAQTWGYGGFMVANVFALRSTDPKGLYSINDPVG